MSRAAKAQTPATRCWGSSNHTTADYRRKTEKHSVARANHVHFPDRSPVMGHLGRRGVIQHGSPLLDAGFSLLLACLPFRRVQAECVRRRGDGPEEEVEAW